MGPDTNKLRSAGDGPKSLWMRSRASYGSPSRKSTEPPSRTAQRRRSARKLRETKPVKLDSPRGECHLRGRMAVRSIVRFPDSRLRQSSAAVKAIDDDVRRVVADMTDSMYA